MAVYRTYKKAVKEITSVRLDEKGILQQDAVGDEVDDAPDKVPIPSGGPLRSPHVQREGR